MTKLERYINDANKYGATVVVKEITQKVNELTTTLRTTKNDFRRTCIKQEIESYNAYRNTIETMFID